ncbi:pleiotropic drug resistance protein 1-like protein isoform X2, partial [Tanacetum coccineum]
MDEISTGLDSSTTFQIVNSLKQYVHILEGTVIISLLQPAPETYNLFDEIILLSDGKIVYEGPRENVLEFFESMGFKCPDRKGVADFLQEVTSKKDQKQYWMRTDEPYRFVTSKEFAKAYESFHVGRKIASEVATPYDKSKSHPAALTNNKYGLGKRELLKACMDREVLLMKRNSFVYFFKLFQLTVMGIVAMTVFFRTKMHRRGIEDGGLYVGALFFGVTMIMFNGMAEISMTIAKLPVFYKQRDFLFFPTWVYALPSWFVKIPVSFVEAALWTVLTYHVMGFDPNIWRERVGAGRRGSMHVHSYVGTFTYGGGGCSILAPWVVGVGFGWGWRGEEVGGSVVVCARFLKHFFLLVAVNQMSSALFRFIGASGRNMIVANTFGSFAIIILFSLGGFVVVREDVKKWVIWGYWTSPMMYAMNGIVVNEYLGHKFKKPFLDSTLGRIIVKSRGLFAESYWYWISIVALLGFMLFYNLCYAVSLQFLDPFSKAQANVEDNDESSSTTNEGNENTKRGMVLPFEPHCITFDDIKYSVDMPQEMKDQGVTEDRLVLLKNLSGAFRPGVLTALMGVSGAGKTTLMDVLAGRKTGGLIEGDVRISGYPKNQETFARISGYCEQNDIHSPHVTVYESLIYSAWLRLPADVNEDTRKASMFVNQVMDLVELNPIKDALVGLPGVNGLSTEQRKRLTIAVELVANPSIIFMDEPTSGLDARAAAIVMRTVRNTVDTGRTVVCTIHQPSIDIFEAFDELFLMKRGGREIYVGPVGRESCELINVGVWDGTLMGSYGGAMGGHCPFLTFVRVIAMAVAGMFFIWLLVYARKRTKPLIAELSQPRPGSNDLHFPTQYSTSFFVQCWACLWKQRQSYWRNPPYTAVRFTVTTFISLMFGTIFWDVGGKRFEVICLGVRDTGVRILWGPYKAAGGITGVGMGIGPGRVCVKCVAGWGGRPGDLWTGALGCEAGLGGGVLVEIPYIFTQAAAYGVIVYAMIGFDWTAAKFFWFFFFMFCSLLYMTFYGMMTVAVSPNADVAAIIAATFYSLWNLFSGFIIPRPKIPIWWRWYYWANPIAWTLYGLIVSQFGDFEDVLSSGETVKEEIVDENQYAFASGFGRLVSDNILHHQELMSGYHRDQGVSRCAFKV